MSCFAGCSLCVAKATQSWRRTKGATAGERFVSVGDASSESLMVRSLNSPPTELSRAQVRLLMSVYS